MLCAMLVHRSFAFLPVPLVISLVAQSLPPLPVELQDHIENLITNMTPEEKVGQLGVFARPGGSDFNPGTSGDWNETVRQIRAGQVGALFNGAGVKPNMELQRVAVEESRLGIPVIFGADVWHGMNTIFPVPLAEAASFEPDLAYLTARATAIEATAAGLHWTYSPMVDVARDQRWGRNVEGAGEDPVLGAAFARARVQGFQGPDLAMNDSFAACLKHFAGYGGVAAGLDYSAADMSEATFRDVFLPPFEAGIGEGALSLMSAFITIIGGIPASGSHWLQTEVLRNELGFSGFVVSDYDANFELIAHGFAANESHAAQIAFTAGVDMDMQSSLYRDRLPELVKFGKVSMTQLNDGVRRILSAKARMGLFANPYRSLDLAREIRQKYIPAHDDLARHAARRSMVLLKNDHNLLPLRKAQKVALVGWWIDDKDNAEGVGVIWGNKSHVISLAEGVRDVVGASSMKSAQGSGIEDEIFGGIEQAKEVAEWADVVVLAVGEPTAYSGEAQSRTDITIPQVQQDLAQAVASTGKPVVVILKNGRAMALEGAVRNATAIIVTWFLGKMNGKAIADVLFGDHDPSGRLPVSFPIRSGQQPYYYNHMSSGRPCGSKPMPFKNCWREIPNEALYPFGHGLTYTSFDYGTPVFHPSADMPWNGTIHVTCIITNTGGRVGEEVVQLYIHDKVASRVRPIRELKAFQKVRLEAGQSVSVSFTLTRQQLEFTPSEIASRSCTRASARIAEPGEFDLWVSPSATAGLPVNFILHGPQGTQDGTNENDELL